MEQIDEILEHLESVGEVRSRRMFGGYGLYLDDHFFAIVAEGVLYLKVDDGNRADFEARGMAHFSYERDGNRRSMSYYELPAEVLEDPRELATWAAGAKAAAERQQAKKPRRKPRKLTGMRNLGPRSAAWLEAAGIHSPEELREVGSIEAFLRVRNLGEAVSLNLLYALEGALMDLRWNHLPADLKQRLKAAAGIRKP